MAIPKHEVPLKTSSLQRFVKYIDPNMWATTSTHSVILTLIHLGSRKMLWIYFETMESNKSIFAWRMWLTDATVSWGIHMCEVWFEIAFICGINQRISDWGNIVTHQFCSKFDPCNRKHVIYISRYPLAPKVGVRKSQKFYSTTSIIIIQTHKKAYRLPSNIYTLFNIHG